jgi:hypothetical protein
VSEVAKRAEIICDRHLRMEIRLAIIFKFSLAALLFYGCFVLQDSKEVILLGKFQRSNILELMLEQFIGVMVAVEYIYFHCVIHE